MSPHLLSVCLQGMIKEAMSKDFKDTDWLALILGGLLYLLFYQWFFSKSFTFRVVTVLVLLVVGWIWALNGAPGK